MIDFRAAEGEGRLEALYTIAYDLGLDCVVEVREEEELEQALERVDPEIVLISEAGLDEDEEDLERTLDLLADVPAGKLVVSEAWIESRRAGARAGACRGRCDPRPRARAGTGFRCGPRGARPWPRSSTSATRSLAIR